MYIFVKNLNDMKTENNQSAFPIGKQIQICEQGMTLRDYFAAKAMNGLVSKYGDNSHISIAVISYDIADAMLKKREL